MKNDKSHALQVEAAIASGQNQNWQKFLDIFREREGRSKLRRHLSLIPYDVMVILFIGQSMLPAWAALLLAAVNFGTWWCYYRIPAFLRMVSGSQGESILIPGPIVEFFAQFINSCGVHHRAHYGLMLAMMAGFHATMTGSLWDVSLPRETALLLGWSCYALLLAIDSIMYWVSLRTLQELKKDSLKEANVYADELKRSNAELEQFASIAAHDLRAPLGAMKNLTEWMTEDVNQSNCEDQTKEYLGLLKGRISRLDRLLNDLLQYSRLGREKTEQVYFSVTRKIQDIFDVLNPDQVHELELDGPEVWVFDYDVTFEVLLANLLGNAVKHNDKDTAKLKVHVENTRGGLRLKIEDNGPGIEEKYAEKVFEIFSTLKPRDEVEASGMGLALVKKIVDQKDGDISITKSAYGGACFNIYLPVKTFTENPNNAAT